jgi:hypothetical protein
MNGLRRSQRRRTTGYFFFFEGFALPDVVVLFPLPPLFAFPFAIRFHIDRYDPE